MAKETNKYDEDYLNALIAKATKSWEGVDVDSYMSELRGYLTDKEVAEKEQESLEDKSNGGIIMTIEERADAYVGHPEEIDEFTSETIKRRAYIHGAKEQKAIDEEVRLKKSDSMTQAEYDREVAFADWYNKNGKGTPTYSDAIEWTRKEVINKACELLKSVGVLTDDDSIMGFIKAMGE